MNWIITVCRNGADLTRRAVKSFLAQDIGNLEVLLIDNGTEDNTREIMRQYENVRIMRMQDASVAECWNAGLGWLFKQGASWVLVCNNDVELRPDTFRILQVENAPFVTGIGVSERKQVHLNPPTSKRPHPDFSCFMIRADCWQTVGPFNEEYKGAYVEDLEFHVRMHKAGIHAYCIDLPFYHERSSTLKNSSEAERKRICEQAERNRELFKQKWGVAPGSPEYYELFDVVPDKALEHVAVQIPTAVAEES